MHNRLAVAELVARAVVVAAVALGVAPAAVVVPEELQAVAPEMPAVAVPGPAAALTVQDRQPVRREAALERRGLEQGRVIPKDRWSSQRSSNPHEACQSRCSRLIMLPEPDDLTKIFTEGVEARAKGLPEAHNPYPAGSAKRKEWFQGWSATHDLDEDDDPFSCRIKSDKDTD